MEVITSKSAGRDQKDFFCGFTTALKNRLEETLLIPAGGSAAAQITEETKILKSLLKCGKTFIQRQQSGNNIYTELKMFYGCFCHVLQRQNVLGSH